MSPYELEDKLRHFEISQYQRNRAEQLLTELRYDLESLSGLYEFWIVNQRTEIARNQAYQDSIQTSIQNLNLISMRVRTSVLEIMFLLVENGLHDSIDSDYRSGSAVARISVEEVPSTALHAEDDSRLINSVSSMFDEAVSSQGADVIADNLSNYGFRVFYYATLLLPNLPTIYQRILEERGYLRSDGGGRPTTRVVASIGQIAAGGIAVVHDSFVSPDPNSIYAGGGLVAAGIGTWPEETEDTPDMG